MLTSTLCLPGKEFPATGTPGGCGLTFLHQMAETLGRAIDARDPNTALHSEQVAELSLLIAREAGLGEQECNLIHIAGHLHDIGKIGIPDSVLLKKGPLTEGERLIMEHHPEIGARIVAPVGLCSTPGGIAEIIRHHHERHDGRGYPHGLSGREIPMGSRIVAVADTYSALMQNRPYRCGTSVERAMAEICRCSGTQFDPDVVDAFAAIASRVDLDHGLPSSTESGIHPIGQRGERPEGGELSSAILLYSQEMKRAAGRPPGWLPAQYLLR